MNAEKTVTKKKESNGQKFKKQFGYSKSMKRNMKSKDLDPLNPESLVAYKAIRKERKKKDKVIQRKKHELAKAQRNTKSSDTKKKK